MSSCLSLFACIDDFKRVISSLYNDELNHTVVKDNDLKQEQWNVDEWDWEEQNDNEIKSEDDFQKNWLQDCCISVSPCEDLIAIGRDDKLVVLTAKWDRQATGEAKTKFEISWTGQLSVEEGECISSVLCLPLASQHRSSQGFPDWTCVVVGFTSGYIRFYLQDGSLLLQQLLHDDPIMKLKCQTWQPDVLYYSFEHVEELVILYPTTLVILDGFSLYQSLRGCRNQLARAQASGTSDIVKPPPLAYKKWNLKGQRNITDIVSCGVVNTSLFDQLQTASLIGGCDASVRITPPAMSQFISTGTDPFLGVFSALEAGTPPLISDVAFEVATKLTSAVLSKLSLASGWLGWASGNTSQPNVGKIPENTTKTKTKVEKGTALPIRYGLSDQRRDGTSVILSPDQRLAVTTDEFGRVMLIDTKQAIVIRTWKGYRDAECGWISVTEEHHDMKEDTGQNVPARNVLFLIIHAPKRGILEVWTTEQGPRAAAFNVGRDCRFLYCGHYILGTNNTSDHPPNKNNIKPMRCVLMQPNGNIKVLTVPFHCALSDKFSRRVRDLHLLKKLSNILDHTKESEALKGRALKKFENTLLEILTSIQVPVLLQQGLQCVLSTVDLPITLLETAIESVLQNIRKKPNVSDDHECEDENDIQTVLQFSKVHSHVLELYKNLCLGLSKSENEQRKKWNDEAEKIQWFSSLFSLSNSEVSPLLASLETSWQLCVAEQDLSDRITVTNFLSCFEMMKDVDMTSTNASTSTAKCCIRIRKNLSTETMSKLGSFFFKDTFGYISSPEKLSLILDSSNILPLDILDLLVFYWLSLKSNIDGVHSLTILHSLLSSLTSMYGANNGHTMNQDISVWWESLRHQLADTAVGAQTLAIAVCCRSIIMAQQTAAKKLEEEATDAHEVDWVSVSMEIERWNLLVNQLDDLLNLANFCLSLHSQRDRSLKENRDQNKEFLENLSVLNILARNGCGISEVVANMVVAYDIEPGCLGYHRTPQRQFSKDVDDIDDDTPDNELECDDPDQLLPGLSDIRCRFPHSLQQDTLWAYCAYQYISLWCENKKRTEYFQKSIEHVKNIDNWHLKHGICVLIWNKVKETVSAMTMLTEKVGKAPKERLCLKAVDMDCSCLIAFFEITRSLLHILAEISHNKVNCDNNERMLFDIEDFWKTGENCQCYFLNEVSDTNESNHELIVEHYYLVSILWLILALSIKSVKPLSLVGNKEKKLLFKEVNLYYENKQVETHVIEERKKFFSKAMSALVPYLSTQSKCYTDHRSVQQISDKWCDVIYDLMEQLAMENDYLKQDFVCELCSTGLYHICSKAFLTVSDKESVSSKLLNIIGQILSMYISAQDPNTTATILANIPSIINSWLRKQDISTLCHNEVNLNGVEQLLSSILNSVGNDFQEISLARDLVSFHQKLKGKKQESIYYLSICHDDVITWVSVTS